MQRMGDHCLSVCFPAGCRCCWGVVKCTGGVGCYYLRGLDFGSSSSCGAGRRTWCCRFRFFPADVSATQSPRIPVDRGAIWPNNLQGKTSRATSSAPPASKQSPRRRRANEVAVVGLIDVFLPVRESSRKMVFLFSVRLTDTCVVFDGIPILVAASISG